MPMNILPKIVEGSYTYSLRVGSILCLLIGVRSALLLRSRSNNLSLLCDLCKGKSACLKEKPEMAKRLTLVLHKEQEFILFFISTISNLRGDDIF